MSKKILHLGAAVAVMMAISFLFLGGARAGTTCTDSDGGKNYYVYGETTGYTPGVGQVYTSQDMCLNTGLNNADLQETWCEDNNEVSVIVYNCPNGCKDGACVSATSSITVISPNGGEELVAGQTHRIKWDSSGTTNRIAIDLHRHNYYGDEAETLVVLSNDPGFYEWIVSDGAFDNPHPKDEYKICVYEYEVVDNVIVGAGDCSDRYFSIVSSTGENLPPVITSLGGPTNLAVQQTGTWTIQANDPDGNYLTYSVDWGDVVAHSQGTTADKSETTSQSATFSHSYQNPDNYTVTFKVTDQQGLSAKSTITVQVGGGVATCTDSDGGKNYYVKGTTYGPQNGKFFEKIDVCRVQTQVEGNYWEDTFSCTGEKCSVREGFCENGQLLHLIEVPCLNGCKDGACITTPSEVKEQVKCAFKGSTTTQECYSEKGSCKGIESCVVNVEGIKGEKVTWKSTCGGYAYTTMDGKNEYAEFECFKKCTDSDGGKNYYVKGETCVGGGGTEYDCRVDVCILPDCEEGQTDCGPDMVVEYYCAGDERQSETIDCPNGCKDGACVGEVVECTADAKVCPDGTFVGRVPPDCEFAPCPSEDEPEEEKTPIPSAGYEDEIITNFGNYRNPFSDTATNSLEGKAAAELYRRGVIGGFSDGEFKGSQPVNRAEAAKFLLLARGIKIGNLKNNNKFRDVKSGEWYEKFVLKAAEKGIINGHPDGSFCPAATVNTVEFLKMLTKTFELPSLKHPYFDVPDRMWFAPFVGIAASKDWSEYKNGYDLFPNTRSPNRLQPARNLTRDEVATAIYQFLRNR